MKYRQPKLDTSSTHGNSVKTIPIEIQQLSTLNIKTLELYTLDIETNLNPSYIDPQLNHFSLNDPPSSRT